MSWRNSFRSFFEEEDSGIRASISSARAAKYLFESSDKEMMSLLEQIGDRDVVVDACLPPQLVRDLRSHDINAVWVPSVLGDGVSDDEIERQLLMGGSNREFGREKRQKVLLTRDVEFYKKVRTRAILVSFKATSHLSRGMPVDDLRREIKKIIRLRNAVNSDLTEKL